MPTNIGEPGPFFFFTLKRARPLKIEYLFCALSKTMSAVPFVLRRNPILQKRDGSITLIVSPWFSQACHEYIKLLLSTRSPLVVPID